MTSFYRVKYIEMRRRKRNFITFYHKIKITFKFLFKFFQLEIFKNYDLPLAKAVIT